MVNNYLSYYTAYYDLMQDTLTSTDSANIISIANLCPNRDGFVVYKARALFNALFGTTIAPDDSCNFTDSSAWRQAQNNNPQSINAVQSYNLRPNPNDGNITIVQKMEDSQPVKAEIYNAIGASVYKGQLQFDTQTQIHLSNIAPGLYLLQLTDREGQKFNLKFIVN